MLGWKLFSTTHYTDPERTFLPRVIPDTAARLGKTTGDFILWIGHNTFIPTQWGTFHLGSEPAGYPGLDLIRHIEKNQLNPGRFKIMDIGQIIPINGSK